jgi:hypothetical protein
MHAIIAAKICLFRQRRYGFTMKSVPFFVAARLFFAEWIMAVATGFASFHPTWWAEASFTQKSPCIS